MERKSLRATLVILFFILIILLGLYFYMRMRREKIEDKNDSVTIQSPLRRPVGPAEEEAELPEKETEENITAMEPQEEEPAMVMEQPQEPEPAAVMHEKPTLPERYITDHHTVKEGESFSLITGYYWNDIFLWPDLYVRNDMTSEDPDLIFPQEIIDIYNRLGDGDYYTEMERKELIKSYLEVYRIYKDLGPKKNNSVWSLLWCAAKYDHQFLDKYAAFIDPEDLAMARKYVAEEGFLE